MSSQLEDKSDSPEVEEDKQSESSLKDKSVEEDRIAQAKLMKSLSQ